MKRFILILGLIASLFSCEKSHNVIMNNEANEIRFTGELRRVENTAPVTRAIVTNSFDVDNDAATTTYFGVYGYVEETTNHYLINNGKFNAEGTNIGKSAEGTYYWPKSDNNTTYNIDFLAIYPYNCGYARTNDDVVVTLNANEVGSNSVDILYAVTHDQHHQIVNTGNSTDPAKYVVPLHFKHALSLIEFKGKYATGNNITAVTVTKIEFLDNNGDAWEIVKDGTLTFDMSSIEHSTSEAAPNTYVPVFAEGSTKVNNLNFGPNVDLTSSYSTISSSILVPQDIPYKVRITFDITIQNTTGEAILFSGRQVTKTISSGNDMANNDPPTSNQHSYASVTEWASGHHYIYYYNITAEGVEFSVTVDNWGTPSGWQIWDHDDLAYVEHFFDKASTQMGLNSSIA